MFAEFALDGFESLESVTSVEGDGFGFGIDDDADARLRVVHRVGEEEGDAHQFESDAASALGRGDREARES